MSQVSLGRVDQAVVFGSNGHTIGRILDVHRIQVEYETLTLLIKLWDEGATPDPSHRPA